MRKFAWLKGLSLSDHGLKHVERVKKDGKWVKVELGTVEYPAKSEKEVFELLHRIHRKHALAHGCVCVCVCVFACVFVCVCCNK
jgi:hypothetical protein